MTRAFRPRASTARCPPRSAQPSTHEADDSVVEGLRGGLNLWRSYGRGVVCVGLMACGSLGHALELVYSGLLVGTPPESLNLTHTPTRTLTLTPSPDEHE